MTEHSEEIAQGVSDGVERGVRNSRIHLNDRRLIILYLVGALILGGGAWGFQHEIDQGNHQAADLKHQQDQLGIQQQQLVKQQAAINASLTAAKAVCEAQATANAKFNAVVDQAITNAKNSTGLTPDQKTAAIAQYQQLHLFIPDCSKLAS
jgi:hypothetical protein